MISLKSPREILLMRHAGEILSLVHAKAKEALKVGVTTRELDEVIAHTIASEGGTASFYNYEGFPASACISVNEVVIHGIPGDYVIKDGDVVSLDIGVYKNGYHSDAARTYVMGKSSPEVVALVDNTKEAFYQGLKFCRQGYRLSDISHAIELHAKKHGLGILREYTGHGIGSDLHESPQIPNYGEPGRGPRLQAGMTLAIEPMFTLGKEDVKVLEDGWTVVCVDGKPAAHYEHTVLITQGEPEILTNKYEVCYHG